MKVLRSTMWIGSTYCHVEKVVENLLDLPYSLSRPMAIYRKESCLLTPGEYIENPWYFSALLVSSYDVETVIIVYRLGEPFNPYPPATAGAFNRDVVGVLVVPNSINEHTYHQIQNAKRLLELAGAMQVCIVIDEYKNSKDVDLDVDLFDVCDNNGFIYGYDALKNMLRKDGL